MFKLQLCKLFAKFNLCFQYATMLGAYLNEEFHGQFYARGQNLGRLLRKAYDDVLKQYDVLIMPTIPFVAQKLPTDTPMRFEGR